jgi:hypothetical protein
MFMHPSIWILVLLVGSFFAGIFFDSRRMLLCIFCSAFAVASAVSVLQVFLKFAD